MYKDFFQFKIMPFENTADSRFYFLDGQYRDVLASLVYAVTTKKGLMAVVGTAGCGKTTIGQNLTQRLPQTTRVVYLVCLENRPLEILDLVAHELDVFDIEDSPVIRLNRIRKKLIELDEAGGLFLLIIDEAQGLNKRVFTEIQNLSNLETNLSKLAQIVLLGRSKLHSVLNLPQMAALRQRLAIIKYLTPMDSESVFKYMKYRLKTAGARYNLFDSEAMTQIFLISRGVPRQINKVCDMCLLKAFLANKKKVDREMVLKSAAELGLEIPLIIKSSNTSSQQLPVTASTVPSDRSAESEEQAFDGLPRVKSDLSENTKVPADPSGGKNKKKAFKPKALMPKTRSKKRRNRGNWLRTATYTAMILMAAALFINLISPDYKLLFGELQGKSPETAPTPGHTEVGPARHPELKNNSDWEMSTDAQASPKKTSDYKPVRNLPSATNESDIPEKPDKIEVDSSLLQTDEPRPGIGAPLKDDELALVISEDAKKTITSPPPGSSSKIKHEPSYPYSLLVSTFHSPDSTAKGMKYYRAKGLSPYWVRMSDVNGNIVYCIYIGLFPDKEKAAAKKNELGLDDVYVVNTQYTALISVADSPVFFKEESARLLKAGYFPYVIPSKNDKYLLLVGAYKQLSSTISECQSISTLGLNCEVIER